MMGGQMTSRNIGGLTYEVTLTAYRDTLGIPIGTIDQFNYTETGGALWSAIHSVPITNMTVFGNGVEEYTYVDTITFPNGGNFELWFDECCRNAAILNIVNNFSFYLNNKIFVDPTNSSPVFLNPPITVAQLGVPFSYNPLPFDTDGDSISWVLDIPLTSGGVPVTGYSLPFSDPSSPFAMNPVTGEITFLPNTIGHFEASFKVNEYRNGVQIGEIRRDMQIIVVPSLNAPPIVSASANTAPYSGKHYDVLPGNNVTISLYAYDPDGQSVTMAASGEPFQFANNNATFTVTNTSGSSNGEISWSPIASQARIAPYQVVLRVSETYGGNTFQNDITFSIRVGNFTGVDVLNHETIRSIYPNPNDGNFTLELNAERSGSAKIIISTMIGQQVRSIDQNLETGTNLVYIRNANLPAGNYMVSILKDGIQSKPQNLNISK